MSAGKVLLGVGLITGIAALVAMLRINDCGPNSYNDMGCHCNDGYHPNESGYGCDPN